MVDRGFGVHSGLQPHSRSLSLHEWLAVSQREGPAPSSCQVPGPGGPLALTCSLVLVIWRRVQRSSSRSRCSCRPRRSRYSLSIWMIWNEGRG